MSTAATGFLKLVKAEAQVCYMSTAVTGFLKLAPARKNRGEMVNH